MLIDRIDKLIFESIPFFVQEFKLIDKAELAPLIDLIESIVSVCWDSVNGCLDRSCSFYFGYSKSAERVRGKGPKNGQKKLNFVCVMFGVCSKSETRPGLPCEILDTLFGAILLGDS